MSQEFDQLDHWESLQEDYNEAKKEFDEASHVLEKLRQQKEDFLATLLFGIE